MTTAAAGRRAWRPLLGLLFYALLAIFLVRYLARVDWTGLRDVDPRALPLLLAIPLSLLPRALQPVAWARLIRGYGAEPPPYPATTLVYAKSWLARYVPGKVAALGGRVLFGSRYGVGVGVLALTSLVEAGIQLVTALGLSFLLFAVSPGLDPLGGGLRAFALIAFALMVVALLPPVFNRAMAWIAPRARRTPARPPGAETGRLTGAALLGASALYVLIHLAGGLPVYLVVEGIYPPLQPADAPYLVASLLLAGSLGTLAVFAPSGIGVREGILVVLLDVVMPTEVTVVAVVALRLWSVAMDLLFYLAATALERTRRGEGPGPGPVRP